MENVANALEYQVKSKIVKQKKVPGVPKILTPHKQQTKKNSTSKQQALSARFQYHLFL